ncbi:hypothetical protein [Leptolyngbya sp. BC1307]|uniref:hypothetical protein n=1 Tax=Leptolyngbya sp. BC1307 TaxID=2029589 RepID=UPI000EFD130E|nr:hypothetical protein [Leptolyngbya sp. BC1307]
MFVPSTAGVFASTASDAGSLPAEPVRHMLFGTPSAVQVTIQQLHHLNYAEPNDWSQLLPTGRPNEVMAILTKRVRAA